MIVAATTDNALLQRRQRTVKGQVLRHQRRHYAAPASSDDAQIAPASLGGPRAAASDSPT